MKFFSILLLLFSSVIIAFTQDKTYVKVRYHLVDDSFDDASKIKLNEAVKKLEAVFNSDQFSTLVEKEKFLVGNYDMSSADIYHLIKSGKNNYKNSQADGIIDLKLQLYDKYKGGNEFGRTDMCTRITETHRCYVLNNDIECYVIHLAHEYMHQIGFYDVKPLRTFFSKKSSVPYKIGNIVKACLGFQKECSKQNATCTKQEVTNSVATQTRSTPSITDNLIEQSFAQGRANNCAGIALIKAAMLKYGYNQLFTYQENNGAYLITLKNRQRLVVTMEELDQIKNTYAKFKLPDTNSPNTAAVQFHAYLAYAAMTKYIHTYGYWGCENEDDRPAYHFPPTLNFSAAAQLISKSGLCTDNIYRLLGLRIKDKIHDFEAPYTLPAKGVVLYSQRHAVAVNNGQVDCYGDWESLSANKACSNEFDWYFELEDE